MLKLIFEKHFVLSIYCFFVSKFNKKNLLIKKYNIYRRSVQAADISGEPNLSYHYAT